MCTGCRANAQSPRQRRQHQLRQRLLRQKTPTEQGRPVDNTVNTSQVAKNS